MPTSHDNDYDDVPPVSPPPPPEDQGGEKKPAEVWAAQKGMYPQFLPAPATAPFPPGTQIGSFGTVAVNMGHLVGPTPNPEYGRFAAAKVSLHWPEGKEMTEAEFDEAVKAAGEHVGR
jgi:hypothetical protein